MGSQYSATESVYGLGARSIRKVKAFRLIVNRSHATAVLWGIERGDSLQGILLCVHLVSARGGARRRAAGSYVFIA
jgi:hypothetical protein